jgi:hypothetical protein
MKVAASVLCALAVMASGLAVAIAGSVPTPVEAQNRGPRPFGGLTAVLPPTRALEEARKLNAAVAALQPQRPGVMDVYVLSAGINSDGVFAREAIATGEILASRYGAVGRTLIMTNGGDPKSDAYPAATPNQFAMALAGIAAVMDKKEDLFVLYVTAHGRAPQGIGFVQDRMFEMEMAPGHLKGFLDDAGFENRLLIISACHSGIFVPALSAPKTAIFTASAADRVSFGCQPTNDWTYFGQALIGNALKSGLPIVQAFEAAKKEISAKEALQGYPASNPQSAVGADAAGFLARIEAPPKR